MRTKNNRDGSARHDDGCAGEPAAPNEKFRYGQDDQPIRIAGSDFPDFPIAPRGEGAYNSNQLPNASLFMTPSISGLVSVAPPGSGTIPAGQTGTIYPRVSIPASTPLGTYDGTIHIMSGNATVAEPLSVIIHVVSASTTSIPQEASNPSPDRIATTSDGLPYV